MKKIVIASLILSTLVMQSCNNTGKKASSESSKTASSKVMSKQEQAIENGKQAYIWGIAGIVGAKIRMALTSPLPEGVERPPHNFAAPLNQLGGAKTLAGADNRDAVGYNNDTQYGVGLFDLNQEPFIITTPDFGDRYWNIMISDMYSDVVGNLGSLNNGGKAPVAAIVGPNWDGDLPASVGKVFHCPSRFALVANRIYVAGMADLVESTKLQKQVKVQPLGSYLDPNYKVPEAMVQTPLIDPNSGIPKEYAYFEMLGNLIKIQAPNKNETFDVLGTLAQIGITPEKGFDYASLDHETKTGMLLGLKAANEEVQGKIKNLGQKLNGWNVNMNTGRAGTDYLLRAAIAVDIPYPNVPEEALYFIGREDANGEPLSGTNKYTITFEKGQFPPVGAFWSITMYDMNGLMVYNPIDRYSIGDRTPGVKTNADGSLTILIQNEKPTDTSNWLPSYYKEFYMYMRLYVPKEQVLEGKWSPPVIKKVQ